MLITQEHILFTIKGFFFKAKRRTIRYYDACFMKFGSVSTSILYYIVSQNKNDRAINDPFMDLDSAGILIAQW